MSKGVPDPATADPIMVATFLTNEFTDQGFRGQTCPSRELLLLP